MLSSKPSIPLDLFIAIIVAITAGFLSVYTYLLLANEGADATRGTVALPRGSQTFRLNSANGCAGELTSVAEVEDSLTVLRLEGGFDFELRGEVKSAAIVGRTFFNPLGQMGLGYVAFEADGRRISADAKDVNPIRISFKVESQTPGVITGSKFQPTPWAGTCGWQT